MQYAINVALGSLWLWLVGVAMFMIITYLVETKRSTAAMVSFLATVIFFELAGRVPIMEYVLNEPITLFFWLCFYIIFGTAWGVTRWFFFVYTSAGEYDEALESLGPRPTLFEIDMLKIKHHYDPKIADHKDDFILWMTYWPFSLIWTLLNNPISKAFNWIFREISYYLQAGSDSIFAGVKVRSKVVEAQAKEREELIWRNKDEERKARDRAREEENLIRRSQNASVSVPHQKIGTREDL